MKNMIEEIQKLKIKKNALILAHNYQLPQVQEIADIVGDSLKLSQEAKNTNKDIIVFCGVDFMAETAKILSPKKKILLPVKDSVCPMAEMVDIEVVREYKRKNPEVKIVTYVNSKIDLKIESDICCTSSNAVSIIEKLEGEKVLFLPDKNLGSFIKSRVTNKNIILWSGYCPIHENFKPEKLRKLKEKHKNALALVHPESPLETLEEADFIGSTSQIIDYVKKSNNKEFIIGTEIGILHKLAEERDKVFYPISERGICSNMKKTRLKDIYRVLKDENNEIIIEEDLLARAYEPIAKMLELS